MQVSSGALTLVHSAIRSVCIKVPDGSDTEPEALTTTPGCSPAPQAESDHARNPTHAHTVAGPAASPKISGQTFKLRAAAIVARMATRSMNMPMDIIARHASAYMTPTSDHEVKLGHPDTLMSGSPQAMDRQ
jgi:hypothetical protein